MKKTFFLLCIMAFAAIAGAKPVTQDMARKVAETFWGGKATLVQGTGFEQLYVFDMNEGAGFVIVPADDCAYPILAYSHDSQANGGQEMNPEVRFWLGQYEEEIAYCSQHPEEYPCQFSEMWQQLASGSWQQPKAAGSVVLPMLTTTWDQSPYYNNYCPTGTPAGCSAIATAQVMKYWNYPERGTGSHSYHSWSYGDLSADFGNTTYDWANMPDALTRSSTSQQVDAVATLCYHVGVSMNMDYGPDGSGAQTVGNYNSAQAGLVNYFGYSSTLHGVYKRNYTNAAWVTLMKDEMDAGRPVIYAGYDDRSGHAFVFDGYNSLDQFHVNWGWGGYYDGYYSVGVLNPGGGGIGSNSSNSFNGDNQAVIGIEPYLKIRLSGDYFVYAQEGGSDTIMVTSGNRSNLLWNVSTSNSWLTVSPTQGDGSGQNTVATITAAPNNTGAVRYGTVMFLQNGDTAFVAVSQLARSNNEMCGLKVYMTDRRGDGWRGGSLTFSSTDGFKYGTITLDRGYCGEKELKVLPDSVVVTWTKGYDDSECGFYIENNHGRQWLSHNQREALDSGMLAVLPAPCATEGGEPHRTYTIQATANSDDMGTVTGGAEDVEFGTQVTLRATPKKGYRFVRWFDQSYENPRTVTVSNDLFYQAVFADMSTYDTVQYDNGKVLKQYNPGNHSSWRWAVRLDRGSYVGHATMTGVQYFSPTSAGHSVMLYQGGTISPINMTCSTYVSQNRNNAGKWVTVMFNNPVDIDPEANLWVVIKPANGLTGAAAMAPWCGNDNGSWVSDDGNVWRRLSGEEGNGTFMVRAIMPRDRSEYSVNVFPNNRNWGTATGGGLYRFGELVTLEAIPYEGYHFVRWNDSNTHAVREIAVSDNTSYRAIFAEGEVGVDDVDSPAVGLLVDDRMLTVKGAEGCRVGVYDIMGRKVWLSRVAGNEQQIALPALGVYLVCVDGAVARKVVAL